MRRHVIHSLSLSHNTHRPDKKNPVSYMSFCLPPTFTDFSVKGQTLECFLKALFAMLTISPNPTRTVSGGRTLCASNSLHRNLLSLKSQKLLLLIFLQRQQCTFHSFSLF